MQDVNLASYSFFEGMKKEHLDLLSSRMSKDTFKANEYVFQEKQEANKLFLILKGKVSIEVTSPEGKPFSIQTLKEGEILGWSWMISPYEWRFNARVIENTELLIIDGEYIRKKSEKDHDLGYEIFKRLAGIFVQRLEATRQQLLEMYHAI
ncbi:MAG: Crp/Fnr family transcriptional regulator [Candidatus Omnitrophica bacterium]|nr:Crp/Fnr family transcriptional regulator [Candidatus Omnitrophota bacterium]